MEAPAGGAAESQTAAGFFERAEALVGFGRVEDAIAELRRGLAEFPDDSELLGYLGWQLFFAGQPQQAEQLAHRTLAVRPGDPRALNTLCETTIADGRADEGLAHARELQQSYPDWPVSHLNAARALIADPRGPRKAKQLRRREARASLDRALQLAPEDVETLRRTTVMLRELGDLAAASDTLDRALALDPDAESLRLLAAERESERAGQASPRIGGIGAAHEAAALRLLAGVLADNPVQRSVAREISDRVWGRTQLLAGLALWMLAMLTVFAYLVFGEPSPGSRRTQVKFAEAMLVLPMAWFVLLFTIRTRGLPKRFMRRLYAPVWWVWIGFALAAVGGLGTLLWALTLGVRSGERHLEMQGSYIGGVTMGIGFTAWLLMIAEVLFVFARFRSEQRTGLFPRDDEGLSAARQELRNGWWGLARVSVAVLLALMPVYAKPIEMRPEAAGALAAVAAAFAVPPLVALLLRAGRVVSLRRGSSRTSPWLVLAALACAAAGIAGAWLLADRHAAEFDPPPTPMELEMRERTQQLQQETEERRSSLPDDDAIERMNRSLEEIRQRNQQPQGQGGAAPIDGAEVP